jgi:isoamylase
MPDKRIITITEGETTPLGATASEDRINFAIYTPAESVRLLLFPLEKSNPSVVIDLDPAIHKSDKIWHVALKGLPADFDYSWEINGHRLCDPYAKALASPRLWKQKRNPIDAFGKARFLSPRPFDWQGIRKPKLPLQDLIIYEMHVRGFTCDSSSGIDHPGTYLGIVEKIPYFLELGINAIELLPIYEFNEIAYRRLDPVTKKRLCDYWGYNHLHFFCPMKRYASGSAPEAFLYEFKVMVRELHRHGIEVILDVVYNHTGEGNDQGPVLSWKGLDRNGYYLIDDKGGLKNYSGCGNTFACNREPGLSLIHQSLLYFADELQVDGFRFDLSPILTRGDNGAPLPDPLIFKSMREDPRLKEIKWIMEPWDAGGLYQVGESPKWGNFSEWNGRYRDVVRRFIKGTDAQAGAFATALCGSQDLYGSYPMQSLHSINFVTCHDGFSLYDLVSYQGKHNKRNGENNHDGANDNESWNCGAEGTSHDRVVIYLRRKQIKNYFTALLLSKGIPMLLMGDEYGISHEGNNNTWCQDNELNWFNWKSLNPEKKKLFRFLKKLIALRKAYPKLRTSTFFKPEEISWHGLEPNAPDWNHDSRLIAFSFLLNETTELFAAFHPFYHNRTIKLPESRTKKPWQLLIDTSNKAPDDFVDDPITVDKPEYTIKPYSAIVLIAGDLVSF